MNQFSPYTTKKNQIRPNFNIYYLKNVIYCLTDFYFESIL